MEWVKIGDVATYINGYAFKPNQWKDAGIPIIRIQNLTSSHSDYNFTDIILDDKYKVTKGDILISWSATLDVYEWDKDLAYLNQHIFKVVFDKEEINKDFFKYFVKYSLLLSSKNAHGSTMKHLTRKNFENINIPKLSFKTQEKMANILNKLSRLIIIRKEQIQAYDDLIESLFFEMFGNPITNNKNFKTNKFINVVKLKRGYDLPVKSRVGNKYDVYGSNGVLDRHNDFKVDKAGIITGRSGTIGKVFRNKGMYWPLNTTLYSEKTYDNNIIFLEYLLENFKLERFATGTGVPTLNRNIVHKEEIIDVPIEMQNKFANYVLKIEEEKKKLRASLNELEILFDALMQDAFSGNLFKE